MPWILLVWAQDAATADRPLLENLVADGTVPVGRRGPAPGWWEAAGRGRAAGQPGRDEVEDPSLFAPTAD